MNSENPYCILAKCVITSCTTGKLQFVSKIQEYIQNRTCTQYVYYILHITFQKASNMNTKKFWNGNRMGTVETRATLFMPIRFMPTDSCPPIHAHFFHARSYSCPTDSCPEWPIHARAYSCPELFMPYMTYSCPYRFMPTLFIEALTLFMPIRTYSCPYLFMPYSSCPVN